MRHFTLKIVPFALSMILHSSVGAAERQHPAADRLIVTSAVDLPRPTGTGSSLETNPRLSLEELSKADAVIEHLKVMRPQFIPTDLPN